MEELVHRLSAFGIAASDGSFLAGQIDTAFFDRHGLSGPAGLAAPLADPGAVRRRLPNRAK